MNVDVTARGDISDVAIAAARERIEHLERFAHAPVLGANIVLTEERNPKVARPSRAEGQINLNGHILRGHVAAAGMPQAIDGLAARLRRQIGRFVDRHETLSRRSATLEPGEWRHEVRERLRARPSFARRAPEDREIVRRKAFAIDSIDRAQAAAEMLDLDHEFYLFRDRDTDGDAVIYRRPDGAIGLIDASRVDDRPDDREGFKRQRSRFDEPITLERAVAEMNALHHHFLFFVRAQTGRGNVIYLRYDGNYGLIEPVDL